MLKAVFRLLTELSSRKFISRLAGSFAKSKWSKPFIRQFAKVYNISIDEAELPIDQYTSLNQFFTRKLKPNQRPIESGERSVISPVDAKITAFGTIDQGTLMDVKGQSYTLQELLHQSPRMLSYDRGTFIVLYLSPRDYHRIHSPVDGEIVESDFISGKVYPVNEFALTNMSRVLSRNVRLVTYIEHTTGQVAVVKVGALNVSSIQYVTPLPPKLEKGQELAYFEFGSTVVLLFNNDSVDLSSDLSVGDYVRVGQRLGQFVRTDDVVQ